MIPHEDPVSGALGFRNGSNAVLSSRRGCDAIVMGRHGKSTLGDILVGSVAIKVLHASKLPVMLVR